MLRDAQRLPGATYRFQLHKDFPLAQAEALFPYLAELGITECYLSPIFLSAPGSTHGYDVNDYRKIDPELGGAAGFDHFAQAARERSIGVILDFVPNHMGINGPFNPWWRDVLACGSSSPYASFFDIYWNERPGFGGRRVLVPILDGPYGRVLEAGRLQLTYRAGELAVRYGEMDFPLSPETYAIILRPVADDATCPAAARAELTQITEALAELARVAVEAQLEGGKERAREIDATKRRLAVLAADPAVRGLIDARLRRLNGSRDDPHSFDALHDILEEQHYRLAHWKTGAHETNYRRFFAIDSLVGLRMEDPEVFRETHALVGRLLGDGRITGLRIDHVDGLWDPEEYLGRLQKFWRKPNPEGAPLFVVAEKILAVGESLPASWPLHGTTGYEFIGQLAGLFVKAESEKRFTDLYAAFTGRPAAFGDIVYEKKRVVLEELFANVVNNLAAALSDILDADRCWRDLTRHELTVIVREIMANLGVYRTYRRMGAGVSETDRREIESACARAIARSPLLDALTFEFVRDLLLGAYPLPGAAPEYRQRLDHWVLTFQQYTGAVMAKAVEDTAFYTYNRLIALNEVGGDPAVFGADLAAFHAANARRLQDDPHSLVTTSTHDTKLSADARARLYVLSELPGEWETWVAEWSALSRPHKTELEGGLAPDANEEYRLYQILLAAWPLEDGIDDTFRQRIRDYLRKAVNEAKENTTWRHPNEARLEACDRFVNALLDEQAGAGFLASFRPRALRLAHLGMINALAQVVLKNTVPGIPDLYQGEEMWDFSLVDPDNRRPVDYARRQQALASSAATTPRDLLRAWKDGAIKLRLTQALLAFRRDHPALFSGGDYQPLAAEGAFASQVAAFARSDGTECLVVIVPRLTARLACPPLGLVWDDTSVRLPAGTEATDVVTGRKFDLAPALPLADLLADLPFAVLHVR